MLVIDIIAIWYGCTGQPARALDNLQFEQILLPQLSNPKFMYKNRCCVELTTIKSCPVCMRTDTIVREGYSYQVEL